MVGGEPGAVRLCEPIFKTLAPENGYAHVDPPARVTTSRWCTTDRVRPHASLCRGLRDHEDQPLRPRPARDCQHLGQGSVVRSWLLELLEDALAKDKNLAAIKGWVEDSGEGRWTVQAAIDQNVPAPVITLSLQTRFRSRQDESYGAKILAALRNEFGGHAVKKS